MKAVRQLHQNDPNISGHGQSHLLEVFSLGFRPGPEFDLGKLADAIHQFRNIVAELLRQGILGNAGVFDHIVKHRRHQALMIQTEIGENMGDSQGVSNVPVAALTHLALMGLLGIIIGASHLIDASGIQIGT